MKATCLHCHARLPGNDVVEAFPFARRVVYDPAKLRYWVVCEKCGKWSLAPLADDERASTVEHLERWWRGSAAHYTTAGIGVGRYSDRFSVVRVGDATWPEFASWRYAEAIKRRRRPPKQSLAATAVTFGAMAAFGFLSWPASAAVWVGFYITEAFVPSFALSRRNPVCLVPAGIGARSVMRAHHLEHLEMDQASGGWALNTAHDNGVSRLGGEEALRALGFALGRINYLGTLPKHVDEGLSLIAEAGGSEAMLEKAAQPIAKHRSDMDTGVVVRYPAAVRVAMEIATREHTERRALENEIALLRHEWREAEEIADIASRLPFGLSAAPVVR